MSLGHGDKNDDQFWDQIENDESAMDEYMNVSSPRYILRSECLSNNLSAHEAYLSR